MQQSLLLKSTPITFYDQVENDLILGRPVGASDIVFPRVAVKDPIGIKPKGPLVVDPVKYVEDPISIKPKGPQVVDQPKKAGGNPADASTYTYSAQTASMNPWVIGGLALLAAGTIYVMTREDSTSAKATPAKAKAKKRTPAKAKAGK